MISLKNLPIGFYSMVALLEFGLFGYALFSLLPTTDHATKDPVTWLYSSTAFLLSRILSRRRANETWVSIGWQSIFFAFFAYIVLNEYKTNL